MGGAWRGTGIEAGLKMQKLALRALSPSGNRARLSVLIFHRVLAAPDALFPEEVDATRFDQICQWVSKWFCVIPLDEAVSRLQSGSLPSRAMAISFDDGYADNHQVAVPILRRYGLSAAFFVATDFLDGGRMWNDTLIEAVRRSRHQALEFRSPVLPSGVIRIGSAPERRLALTQLIQAVKYLEPGQRAEAVQLIAESSGALLPTDLMMTSAQVADLRAQGMVVGAHTASHPILARLSAPAAMSDITRGKARLEEILSEQVTLFAYPNGKPGEDYLPGNVMQVRDAGFHAAFSTAWGAARQNSDIFQIPRFTPWDSGRSAFALRLLHNLATR